MVLVTATFEGHTIRMGLEPCALEHFYEPWITSIDNIQVKMSHAYGGMSEVTWGSVGISQKAFQDRDGVTFMWPPPMTIWLTVRFTNTTEAASVILKEGYGHYTGMNPSEVLYDFMELEKDADVDLLQLTSDILCNTGAITDYNGSTVTLPRAVGFVEHVEPLRLNDYQGIYPRYHNAHMVEPSPGNSWHIYDDGVEITSGFGSGTQVTSGVGTFYLTFTPVGRVTISGRGTIATYFTNDLSYAVLSVTAARGCGIGPDEYSSQRSTAINIGHFATEQMSVRRYVSDLCASYGHMIMFPKKSYFRLIPIHGQGAGLGTVLNDASILPCDYETDSGPVSMISTRWQRRWPQTLNSSTYVQEATRDISANQSVFFQGTAGAAGTNYLLGSGFLGHPTACYGGDMIRRGMSVWNATDRTRSKVASVVSTSYLLLEDHIFSSGDQYQIGYQLPYGTEMEVPSFSIDSDVNQENVKWILSFLHTRKVSVTVPMSAITSVLNYGDRITATERRAFGKPITLNYAKVIGITFDFMNETITYDCAGTLYQTDPQTAIGAPAFSVASVTHYNAPDPIRLVVSSIQQYISAVADGQHWHLADNAVTVQKHTIAVQESAHGHAAESVGLVQVMVLSSQDGGHGHSVDSVVIIQAHLLTVNESTHGHMIDGVIIQTSGELVVAEAMHGVISDSVVLVQAYSITVQEAIHAHGADAFALVQGHLISVNDGVCGHSTDAITVTEETPPTDYVALASCVGAWYMRDTTTETDMSGSSALLSVSSGDTIERYNSALPSGFSGYYRHFTQADGDYLYRSDGGSTDVYGSNQALTLFTRFRCGSSSNNYVQGLVCKYSATGQFQFVLAIWPTSGLIYGGLSANGSTLNWGYGTTNVMTDTAWHTAAMVYNDTDIRVYVDGVLESNGANNPKSYADGIFNSSSLFTIGRYATADTNCFNGDIFEAGIWNEALSASAIAEMHEHGMKGDKGASE